MVTGCKVVGKACCPVLGTTSKGRWRERVHMKLLKNEGNRKILNIWLGFLLQV